MKKLFTCIALLSCMHSGDILAQKLPGRPTGAPAQQAGTVSNDVWTRIPLSQAPPRRALSNATKFDLYRLNVSALRTQFWAVSSSYANASIISIPMPDGTRRDFRVWETPMMDEHMSALYPDIKTFTGEAVNDKRVTAKFDFTLFGFHSAIFDDRDVAFIDPYDGYTNEYYIVHYKSNEERPYSQRMVCGVHGSMNEPQPGGELMPQKTAPALPGTDLKDLHLHGMPVDLHNTDGSTPLTTGDHGMAALTTNGATLRTYRLALSADHFYCQAAPAAATIPTCLSKMTTSMNRVNGVYNREIAVQLNFVTNENLLIWPTATGSSNGNDPFNLVDSDGPSCLDTNQSVCDARIGSANYDVGHVFTTGGGGIAAVGVPCLNGQKARGVTGTSSPVGDAFDIDYVCHELGHQFGSGHTYNNNLDGACGGNASASQAYEPGSGVTIMDYAGICNPDNVQSNSSPYFSASSLERIQAELTQTGPGGGSTCAVNTTTSHTPATIAGFIATYNIPYKTPFELTSPTAVGSGTDTAMTYGWFQWNLGDFGKRFNQTFFNGPIFRSYQPAYTETRIFPTLSNVLSGVLVNSGEKAPDTARYLTFKTVIRNIAGGLGCFRIPDDTIHINAIATGAGNGYRGFRVTSQNTAVTYTGGSTQTITWDVVGTNAAPVSAANVDIYMSTDGGNTWPYTIGTFPNTGTASVSIANPATTTTQARIKVKGSGNVFFNINSSNFTVNPGPTTAAITGTFTVCIGATTDLDDATPGGTWSSSTPAVGTVNNTNGIVTGITAGTTTITYHAGTGNVTAVVTVLAIPAPGAITGNAPVCVSNTLSLSNSTPGGVWSSTNTAVGTVNTSGVVTGISAGTTTISYTVTNGCGTGVATVNVTVNAPVAVNPITGTPQACVGSTTALGNTTPSGVWSSTSTAVGTVNTSGTVTGIAAGTTTISYTVTGGGCTSASSVVVTVNSTPAATVSPSGTVTICTGGSQVLTASPSTAGLTYQWQDGGTDITGETNATYTATAAGTYRVRITAGICTGTSTTVTVSVSGTAVTPSVSVVTTPGTNICSAVGVVTFTATPVNGGSTPAYQWYVNSTAVGTSSPTYAYTPANGDIVTCVLTSSLPCATPSTASDADTMTVATSVTPGISIAPDPNDTICTGGSVTYNAVPVNGGPTPAYLWRVNGISVGTGPSYSTTPANGDVVLCQMTGSAACASAAVVTSAPLVMTVQAPATNVVHISASPTTIHPGETITFAAIAPNAGPSPVYQWFIDGVLVPGATSATYVTSSLVNGQVVHCKVTTSMACVTPPIALSNGFTVSVTSGIWEVTKNGSSFTVSPNPNKGTFTVNGRLAGTGNVSVYVANMLGQTVYSTAAQVRNGSISEEISLDASLPAGTYMVIVTAGEERAIFRIVTQK
ncbi:hypothetical protein GCM10023093_12510 [Nemorincola caseinilytica]|uniref:PKD domain-containing protein n=1 Tax=Nemorincola caseinilytica TaxID=2054315 RepID=A0ABP8NCQ2_9BACT